jgi:hypothetical protein
MQLQKGSSWLSRLEIRMQMLAIIVQLPRLMRLQWVRFHTMISELPFPTMEHASTFLLPELALLLRGQTLPREPGLLAARLWLLLTLRVSQPCFSRRTLV